MDARAAKSLIVACHVIVMGGGFHTFLLFVYWEYVPLSPYLTASLEKAADWLVNKR